MTLDDIKEMADKAGLDISTHTLSLPIERQKEVAKLLGYDDFTLYVQESIEQSLAIQAIEIETVHFATKAEAEKAGHAVPRWYDEPVAFRVS